MIDVPTYLVVGQAALLGLACFVLASAYRRLARPADADHSHGHQDDAADLVGTPLPDLGPMIASDGSTAPPPRMPGSGQPSLLVYVLPGCESCQTALEQLRPRLEALRNRPAVHLLSVGAPTSVDAYRRFDLPIWQAQRTISDIFDLKVYPLFLGVDADGMIRAAGSAHDPDALESYLTIGGDPARVRHGG
jgi:hypothetical protein